MFFNIRTQKKERTFRLCHVFICLPNDFKEKYTLDLHVIISTNTNLINEIITFHAAELFCMYRIKTTLSDLYIDWFSWNEQIRIIYLPLARNHQYWWENSIILCSFSSWIKCKLFNSIEVLRHADLLKPFLGIQFPANNVKFNTFTGNNASINW